MRYQNILWLSLLCLISAFSPTLTLEDVVIKTYEEIINSLYDANIEVGGVLGDKQLEAA